MLIEWNSSFSVGHPQIDNDHKKLIALLNTLCEEMNKQRGRDAVRTVLLELVDYTRTHFAREESYMQATKYPAYEDHHAKHVALIEQAADLMRREANNESVVTIATLNFLRQWLTDHIQGDDRALGAYLATHQS